MDVKRDKNKWQNNHLRGGVPTFVQFLNAELTSKFYENCFAREGKGRLFFNLPSSQRLKYW